MSRARITRCVLALIAAGAMFAGHPVSADTICDTTSETPLLGGLVTTVDQTTDGLGLLDLCSVAPAPSLTIEPTATASPTSTAQPDPVTEDPPRADVPPANPSVPTSPEQQTPREPAPTPTSGPTVVPSDAPGPTGGTDDHVFVASAIVPASIGIAVIVIALVAAWMGLIIGRRRGRRAGLSEAGALLDALEDGIVVCDEQGTIIAVNGTASRLLGTDGAAATGQGLHALLEGRDDRGREMARLASETSEPVTFEGSVGRARTPVRVAVAPVLDGSRTIGRALIMRDLREQRRLARMKSEILSNVGHELRTPLTSALGFARLVQTRDLSPQKARAFISAIVDACEKLERVIDLLIDVATVESGKQPTDLARLDLTRLLTNQIERWRGRSRRHVFELDLSADIGAIIGNGALLVHAVDELLDNAVKFSPDAGTITVQASRTGDTVTIAVSDHGIGIAPEHLGALFEDFAQVDASATRSFGGLGLGLGLVRRVARAHGGSVTVDSLPGRGTTFRLMLPVTRSIPEPAGARADQPTRTAAYARAGAGV